MNQRICMPILAVLSFLLAVCCKNAGKPDAGNRKYIELAHIDSSVRPGNDFFLFANGKWMKTAVIPPTESRVGAMLDLFVRTKQNIRSILEEAAKGKNSAGSIEQKVGDFYASGMDSATVDKMGYGPVKPLLAAIDSIRDAKAVMHFAAAQLRQGYPLIIGQYVGADEKNSAVNIAVYYQSGLGLPDRDYYFKKDAATQSVVAAYRTYLATLLKLTGDDSAAAGKKVNAVFDLESKMAANHRTNVELRDPPSNYHKMAVADLQKKMPVVGWKELLPLLSVRADSVNLAQPRYYEAVNTLLQTVPLDTWKAYLKVRLLANAAPALSSDFVDADFAYTGRALRGQQLIKPRWERVYAATDASLGEALGQLYVKKYFTEDAKKRMLELVDNLQTAFEARIAKLDWMSDSTKQKAKEKLHTFIKKIGFPDKWRDYSNVVVNRDTYYDNLVSAAKNEYAYQVAKVGKPVDKGEWGMSPPTINAYYNPTFNEIVFPAGILQQPFFDLSADDAINYGGIGMVIGHEMTHGFDDQGAQYDKDGNLKNWWSEEDNRRFKEKGALVADLYSSFVVLDSMHINGRLTLGENIADIGGLAIAYDAFKLTDQGKDTVRIDGLTPDQRFFLAFAQTWRGKRKDESLRQQINTDPHSPAMYRVWGPLMNFPPFYEAFDIREGDVMWRPEKDRIRIW